MITAHDGGVDISTDGGKTWRAPPLPIAQFYHVACDTSVPYRVMGCMQDIGTASGPSNSLNSKGILVGDWYDVGGGEAGYAVPDPTDPNIIYAGEYGGYISRYDHRTRQTRHVGVYPYDPSGHGAEDLKYRFQWTSPILVSKHDPKTVYHAANVLFRTTNGGQSWEKVSIDLSRNDRNKQKWAGGPITGDNTGVEVYGTIFALAESSVNKKVLWAGSDDGLVHVSKDTSYTWKNVTANVADLPTGDHRLHRGLAVRGGRRISSSMPTGWTTTGRTSGRLPTSVRPGRGLPTTCRPTSIAASSGPTKEERAPLPRHGAPDLALAGQRRIVAPTPGEHADGRDLRSRREGRRPRGRHPGTFDLDPGRPDAGPRMDGRHRGQARAPRRFRRPAGSGTGRCPPSRCSRPATTLPRAIFHYYLKDKAKNPVVFEVYDSKNTRIARIEGRDEKERSRTRREEDDADPRKPEIPASAGVNRWSWDLTHERAQLISNAKLDSGGPTRGPRVAPGKYTVKLLVDGKTLTTAVEVKMDPRVTEPRGTTNLKQAPQKIDIAPRAIGAAEAAKLEKAPWVLRRNALDLVVEEAAEQEQFTLRLRDDVSRLTGMVRDLRNVQKQLVLHEDLLAKQARAKPFLKQGKELGQKLKALEEKLHNPRAKVTYDILAQKGGAKLYSQLGALYQFATGGDGPPTQGMKQLADEFEKELADHEQEFDDLRTGDVAKLNELARKLNVPMIWMPVPKR